MATVTKTTVEAQIGEYIYRAELDGNEIALFRDGVSAGLATWNGGQIEGFPPVLSEDARDDLTAAIVKNLGKAWRGVPETFGQHVDVRADPEGPSTAPKTQDAANQGQMGNELGRPARQERPRWGRAAPATIPPPVSSAGRR